MTIFAVAACALPLSASTNDSWAPPDGSWQKQAVEVIWSTFGDQSFDKVFWSDEENLTIIRPSYDVRQNLLATTVCRSIADVGPPEGEQIALTFYDTDAFERGELVEHASVTCG